MKIDVSINRNIKIKHCEGCGLSFASSRWDVRYCSVACKQRAYRARHPFQIARRCACCGVRFMATRRSTRYCCNAHRQKVYREQKKLAALPETGLE